MTAAPSLRWLPAHAAQPLAWWDERRLAQVAAHVGATLAPWQRAWGVAPTGAAVDCRPLAEAFVPADGWRGLALGAETAAWLHCGADLHQTLFGAVGGSISARVAAACETDAQDRIAAAFGLQPASHRPMAASAFAPRSGAVVVAAAPWRLVLAPAATLRWHVRPAGGTVFPARSNTAAALARRPVALRAELAGCELSLAALQVLRVGDVLLLRHRLADPALLRHLPSGPPLAAYLGRRGGAKAIELVIPHVDGAPSSHHF